MIPTDIVQRAASHVRRLFAQADTAHFYYHSLAHTEQVVHYVAEIGASESLPAEELQILQVAAWFHDVGHLGSPMENHEMRSVTAAKKFLQDEQVGDENFIQRVADTILATRIPQTPTGKLGEIICDADVYHFGLPQFRKTNKLVRQELKARGYNALTKDWKRRSLRMLELQHFFTPSVRQKLEAGKSENIRWMRKKIADEEGGDDGDKSDTAKQMEEIHEMHLPKEEAKVIEKAVELEKKTKQNLVARGMQTMLRLTSGNHLELSRMADGKANILISVNSIIISVILSFFLDRLDTDPYLTIPTMLFLASSVATVVIAILSTRPKLTEGTFTREAVQRKETNLMFFGNFYKSSLEEYQWAMGEMMHDPDYLYNTLVKDIYYLGIVLGRKYRLIRLAYNIFMVGLILAVVSFSIAILLNTSASHVTITNSSRAPL